MPNADLQNIDPETQQPPVTRIKDVTSLNAVVKKIIEYDDLSAAGRVNVQKMLDGKPPYTESNLRETGQEGRCNLNFGDGKARVKSETAGFYDLTDSVPILASTTLAADPDVDVTQRSGWSQIIAEEWSRTLKDWSEFDANHQLNVQHFCAHGLGFLYFQDDVSWHWSVAGLADFKLPRGCSLIEGKVSIAIALRNIPVGELYKWILDVPETDKRWNLPEVRKAIMNVSDATLVNAIGGWEMWQQRMKNNDIFASVTSNEDVQLVHCWVQEFSGRVSQYLTLRDGSNGAYLFSCPNRFDNINQCFNFFPYEIGTNGTAHSVRGLGHEIYPHVQVLNNLRCQSVDNAKLSGSLLLQPKVESDQEDLALMFYGGAAIIPSGVNVMNGQLNNPSAGMLPVINDMTLLMRRNTGDVPSNQPETQRDKTKFEVQSELTKESVLPTASMSLFYQPWKRHLQEVYRRFQNKTLSAKDCGYEEVMDFRKRCMDRGVPKAALFAPTRVVPIRSIGFGSPSARLLALDEFMQYFGSLDPVGQNNLLRARFAQKVGYDQVDEFVPKMQEGGRMPVDVEIAELQNQMMSGGMMPSVFPNDNHILHVQTHNPSLENDLALLESGQGTPALLQGAQVKIQHIAKHMSMIKPDKLQGKVVAELTRQFNNLGERVTAALKAGVQQPAQQPPQLSQKDLEKQQSHEQDMQHKQESHTLDMQLEAESAAQKRAIEDADSAAKLNAEATRRRLLGGIAAPNTPVPPQIAAAPAAAPAPQITAA
jgi:hypothetical protein